MTRNSLGVIAAFIRNAGGVLRVVSRSLYLVRGKSMSPTLRDGDLILVRRASGKSRGYVRGSVVVAETCTWMGQSDLVTSVKRVVGLPGELIHVEGNGTVWVENARLSEPYLPPQAQSAPGPGLTWLCEDDEYFLMGDNRADSGDSRRFGPVPASRVVGRMRLRLPTHRLLSRSSPVRID